MSSFMETVVFGLKAVINRKKDVKNKKVTLNIKDRIELELVFWWLIICYVFIVIPLALIFGIKQKIEEIIKK